MRASADGIPAAGRLSRRRPDEPSPCWAEVARAACSPPRSEDRKATSWVFLSSGRPEKEGIGAVGLSSVRLMAPGSSLLPMSVRFGAWTVVAVLADLVAGETAGLGDDELARLQVGRHLHVDLVRGARGRAEVGQVRHREDHDDARRRRDRPPLGAPLGTAVVERQHEQQHHRDRRHADRRERRQDRRLDHPQHLEEEEEVPLRPRHVGGGRRVRLRPELGTEDERHEHDRRTTITAMIESLATAYGKNGFPLAFSRAYSRRYASFSR